MISIGNDIVALAKTNPQRSADIRFQSKFITAAERGLHQHEFLTTLPFQSYMWLLWSVKESVYKYQQRLTPGLIFAPIKIIIQNLCAPASLSSIFEGNGVNDAFYQGRVKAGKQILFFASLVTDDFVMSVVNDEPSFTTVHWQVRHIEQTDNKSQSLAVRTLLLSKLISHFQQGSLNIKKNNAGCPLLFDGEINTHIPVSLSHHGNFIASCFKLP